jgi:two-component sensor histidine kinase
MTVIPENEAERMAAVRRYDVLDTPPDGAFDRVTALAARRFNVPISIISIVDEDRIWFKSHHGLPVQEIGREPGLCASAILSTEPHILENAILDPRSMANPLVAGEFGLRFYAGVPLTTSDGFRLGTLCVIDKEIRTVDEDQIQDLKDLASIVIDQMELRLSARLALAKAHHAAEQARLMAKEIDHRVMNSLQFVSGLLTMQSLSPNLDDAAGELKTAANRVAAVAQVHRNFYSDDADEVSCIDFLQRLSHDLSRILGREIEVSGDVGTIPTTLVQPVGLIANELITNAAKHGAGKIEVTYRINEEVHELAVCDEGEGVPIGFDPTTQKKSLGMRVLTSLSDQLNGKFTAHTTDAGKGSCFVVSFPIHR